MTINLNPELARLIDEQVSSGRYASADEVVLAGLKLLQARQNVIPIPRANLINDLAILAAEVTKDIPDSEWEKVPTDLAQNHDHYLYGTRKTS